MQTMLRSKVLLKIMVGCVGVMLAGVVALRASNPHAASRQSANVIIEPTRAHQITSSVSTTRADAVSVRRQAPRLVASPAIPPRALLDQYCVTCHNERLKTANLTLDTLDVEHVGEGAEIWEKVVAKLRSGAMPPVGRPRPDKPILEGLTTWLETSLDRAAAATPNPGRAVAHRLNRTEYSNAIRDLLALEIDGRTLLPADEISGSGFDNDADVLTVSTGLMERYMSAARQVARLAVGNSAVRPVTDIYKTSLFSRQDQRISEDMSFGTRGGIVVRQHFPVDGDYVIRIRLEKAIGEQQIMRGFIRRNEVDVRLDGERLAQFAMGGEGPVGVFGGTVTGSGEPIYSQRTVNTHFESLWVAPGASLHHSDDLSEIDAVTLRLPVKAGYRVVTVAFAHNTVEPEGTVTRIPTRHYSFMNDPNGEALIDRIEIGGPYNIKGPDEGLPSRKQIFVCRPTNNKDEAACAKRILTRLARRAYRRRPVGEEDVQPLMSFYQAGRGENGSFEAGIESALVRILVSPQFVFRTERDPSNLAPGSAYRISDVELASRLSFFLWSSIPDEELLDVAVRGRLKDPVVLGQQVRRMIADRRSSTLVGSFVGQWLALRNLQRVAPDLKEFPEFDDDLREALQRETELFFESQLREDRPMGDLLNANYTFLNERLARHYGIPNIFGSHMRRVTLTDETRHGLLGQASILTVTSFPNRTSPTVRGKWVLENILGTPPPAPPPNVPALEEQPAVRYKSVRDRLEAHRKNPVCAACHARIDPMGFALENFDGVGQWRTRDGDAEVDASGVLDGTKFNGLSGLRQLLEARQEQFVTNVTKKLLTYAVGRKIEYYDMPAVRQIVREAGANDYRWSSVIVEIVKSAPFQMRRLES